MGPDRFHPLDAELQRMLVVEKMINEHLVDLNEIIGPYHEEIALLIEGGQVVEG